LNKYISENNNIIVLSVKYFYSFWQIIESKLSIKRIIKIMIRKYKYIDNLKIKVSDKDPFDIIFIIYNILIILLFIIIFLIK
jgi:hypothetical protein